MRDYFMGSTTGVIQGDTRSFDLGHAGKTQIAIQDFGGPGMLQATCGVGCIPY